MGFITAELESCFLSYIFKSTISKARVLYNDNNLYCSNNIWEQFSINAIISSQKQDITIIDIYETKICLIIFCLFFPYLMLIFVLNVSI